MCKLLTFPHFPSVGKLKTIFKTIFKIIFKTIFPSELVSRASLALAANIADTSAAMPLALKGVPASVPVSRVYPQERRETKFLA